MTEPETQPVNQPVNQPPHDDSIPTTGDEVEVVEIEDWDLRSPSDLVADVDQRLRLTTGTAYAVLVREPAGAMQVVATHRLTAPAELSRLDRAALRDVERDLGDLLDTWADLVPPRAAAGTSPPLVVVTFVVRSGWCQTGPEEICWLQTWPSGPAGMFTGDVVTVTEHGWYHFMSRHADHQPAARPALRCLT